MDVDKIALIIVIGLMMIVVLAIFFVIWCMCAAASEADDWSEKWNKNWEGQKFEKRKEDVNHFKK